MAKKENFWGRVEDRWVPLSAMYTVAEISAMLHISKEKVYELARRECDPLPLRRFEYRVKYFVAVHDELMEWVKENLPLIADLEEE